MGIRTEGVWWLVMQGDRNTYPVKCDWCEVQLISYEGRKVQMDMRDELDYNWACPECYERTY